MDEGTRNHEWVQMSIGSPHEHKQWQITVNRHKQAQASPQRGERRGKEGEIKWREKNRGEEKRTDEREGSRG